MQRFSLSIRIYGLLILILILTLSAVLNAFLPQGALAAGQSLPAPRWIIALASAGSYLIIYGGLGLIGLKLAQKLGFADLWDPAVSNRQRFLIPALAGAAIGLLFILIDLLFQGWHGLGPLPHPPFPTSIVASIAAAIGEEVIFRLFFISFWVWLVSAAVLFKGRWQTPIFWIVAVVSALLFSFGHLPSLMFLYGFESFQAVPLALLVEMVVLNGSLSLLAARYFRIYGFLAAVSIHFWVDVVWHVMWGAFS
jgi:membrane protease YdiL (CAAX protease family)